jgi:hypothetical protein
MFFSSKLNLPVDHDVLIAAVAHLEEVGFVKERDEWRGDHNNKENDQKNADNVPDPHPSHHHR